MELNDLVATKTYEPGYKRIATFDLSTGVYHDDSWSAGSSECVSSNGTFVKEDNSLYAEAKHFYYPDTVLATIDTVVDGVQFDLQKSENDVQNYYFLLSSHNDNDYLAKIRFEEYKMYISANYELYSNEDEIWIIDDIYDTIVTMSIVTYDALDMQRNDAWLLCVSVQEEKEVVTKVEPAIGMTAEEVLNSTWGEPDKINKDTYSWGVKEQWVYDGMGYIYLEDGIVTSISER